MSSARRPQRWRSLIPRWITAALPLLLILGIFARGHALQAFGLPVACEHPETMAERADDHASTDGSADDPCPPDCHDCACGQIPTLPATFEALLYALLAPYEIDEPLHSDSPGFSISHRLERPPRRLGA